MDADDRLELFLSGLAHLTEEYGYTFFVCPMLTETEAVPGKYRVDKDDVVVWEPQSRQMNLLTGEYEPIDDDYEVIDEGDTP